MTPKTFHNDEPTAKDGLKRSLYAKALADVGLAAETPLVIGLYGRWGIGKTSLLRQIEEQLGGRDDVATIRFDAWRHQFDEHPALALLHTMVEQVGKKESLKKTLYSLTRAFGAWALRASTPVDLNDVESGLKAYEEQNFLVREAQVRLAERFSEIVEQARGTKKRLVFLIDDLDRCLSEHILRVLEALKLYLNLPGCTYFLAVDRSALELSIREHYGEGEIDEVGYLDKIVQLPFEIPPIEPTTLSGYVRTLLPAELQGCAEILCAGLARNPRAVKRFVNTLLLNNRLAQETIPDPDPEVLAILLLVQYRSPRLYAEIARSPQLLKAVADGTPIDDGVKEEHAQDLDRLAETIAGHSIPEPEILTPYIYLTEVARVNPEGKYDAGGFYLGAALDELLDGEQVLDRLLLFETRRQHTWLVTTPTHLACLLDDENTRDENAVVQWKTRLEKFDHVRFRAYRSETGNWVLDVGRRAPWLYSESLHPDPNELVARVEAMIERAKSG